MNSNFNLLNKCYSYNEYYVDILINFPKKDVILKQSIEKGFYDLIECLFAFNINTSNSSSGLFFISISSILFI